jgi:hypothetical protein
MHRNLRLAGAAIAALLSVSCLEPVQPTPVSDVVTIGAVDPTVFGTEKSGSSFFLIDIRISNKSARRIFVDDTERFVEKLVDQKWVYAYGPTTGQFRPAASVGAQRGLVFSQRIANVKGSEPFYPLLVHVRGLYRIHFRLAYDQLGIELVDSASTYSQPFTVEN